MRQINVYDFDKTIYLKDASFEFWKYCIIKKKKVVILFPTQLLFFILNKLSLVSTKKFKEVFFSFLNFFDKNEIEQLLIEFWEKENKNINKNLEEKIKKSEIENICISASPEFLLKIPIKKLNIDILIATKMNITDGKIIGENCKGYEKVLRLKEIINEFEIKNFYSDSYSDLPLFKISQTKYLIKNQKITEVEI